MRKKHILITDDVHPILPSGLLDAQFEVDYQPEITYEETFQIIPNYEGLIINSKIKCDKNFLDQGHALEFIARLGSGREVIDLEYAQSRQIVTYFSPDGNNNAVAEQALGMLLALSNQLVWADQEVRQKIWKREDRRGWELRGKTIGIIGFGYTGSQFAKKLAGMEMHVLAHDKYLTGLNSIVPFVHESSKEEICNQADIISFHLPWSVETHHYCDAQFMQSCKQGAILMNTSRGRVVQTEALLSALRSGQIGGACLDVFENEKPQTYSMQEETLYQELFQMKQVVLTPHIAGWTKESKYNMAQILLNKILSLYQTTGKIV